MDNAVIINAELLKKLRRHDNWATVILHLMIFPEVSESSSRKRERYS
jgi:hypothetical protein